MNFQQLRFALSLAETGSFTRAADLCCVTQPALSNAIGQLEDELGARLFERSPGAVTPTEFGKLMLADMAQVIEARARLLHHAAEHLARDDRTFRIGLSPLISAEFVEAVLARCKAADPGVNIILTEMNKADLEPALASGAIDFSLGPAPMDTAGLQSRMIYQEPLLFVSNSPTAAPQTLRGLPGQTYLLVHDDCGLSGAVRALFARNNLMLQEYEGRALGYHILEKWARLGIGVTLLPASKVADVSYARPIEDGQGGHVMIAFLASWAAAQEQRASFRVLSAALFGGPALARPPRALRAP